jgi:2-keto-4-pentenoate hydratase/2-oxohepta-3-ene-1,7-dioic acid hydratase in catechol pathway
MISKLKIKGSDDLFEVNNIYCVGKNYLDHIKEFGGKEPEEVPVIFLKPNSSIITDSEEISIPEINGKQISKELHYETELVVAMGGIGNKDVFGYAAGFDMTLRDLQGEAKAKGLPWTTAKGFRTSAPVSEIIPSAQVENPMNIEIKGYVNGELRQSANTSEMITDIFSIINYIDNIFGIRTGDLIFTGTPSGVGKVNHGDLLTAKLGNLIELKVKVR